MDWNRLANAPLFEGIAPDTLRSLLPQLDAREKSVPKGGVLLLAGEPVASLGLLLSGRAQIVREDEAGNRNLLGQVEAGELFAEMFACMRMPSPVTVMAETDVQVLFLPFHHTVAECAGGPAHARLVENMLRLFAQKTLALNEKLGCIGHRTLREKVRAFLLLQREHVGANPFSIPFSRVEMADYLCADRSALSAELSRMRAERLIDYRKNRFELLDGFYNPGTAHWAKQDKRKI